MGKKKALEREELTERQCKVLDKVISLSASLLKLNASSLDKMIEHVQELGTDHEAGSSVDNLTVEILQTAAGHKS